MKAFQPWSDTINLLASGTVTGAYGSDEPTEFEATYRNRHRIRKFVTAGVTRLLLIMGIT